MDRASEFRRSQSTSCAESRGSAGAQPLPLQSGHRLRPEGGQYGPSTPAGSTAPLEVGLSLAAKRKLRRLAGRRPCVGPPVRNIIRVRPQRPPARPRAAALYTETHHSVRRPALVGPEQPRKQADWASYRVIELPARRRPISRRHHRGKVP